MVKRGNGKADFDAVENFAVQPNHVESIKNEGKVYSATGDGKIPWVSADDIAAVAVQTLTMAEAPNTEYLVLGPELLSYDDVSYFGGLRGGLPC